MILSHTLEFSLYYFIYVGPKPDFFPTLGFILIASHIPLNVSINISVLVLLGLFFFSIYFVQLHLYFLYQT